MRYLARSSSSLAPALAPFVESIWWWDDAEIAPARERILPTGAMALLVNLHEDEMRTYEGPGFARVERTRGATLSGPFARHFAIDTAEQRAVVGVNFRLGGAYPFFRAPADATRELHVELDALWGKDGAVLRERLLEARTPERTLATMEAALVEQVARSLDVDAMVTHAVGALERGDPVAAVTARMGMSARRFIATFAARVGLTPKRFARVRRFQRVLGAIDGTTRGAWARLALDCGYYDQAHLIRDFTELAGITPREYRATSGRNHVRIEE